MRSVSFPVQPLLVLLSIGGFIAVIHNAFQPVMEQFFGLCRRALVVFGKRYKLCHALKLVFKLTHASVGVKQVVVRFHLRVSQTHKVSLMFVYHIAKAFLLVVDVVYLAPQITGVVLYAVYEYVLKHAYQAYCKYQYQQYGFHVTPLIRYVACGCVPACHSVLVIFFVVVELVTRIFFCRSKRRHCPGYAVVTERVAYMGYLMRFFRAVVWVRFVGLYLP